MTTARLRVAATLAAAWLLASCTDLTGGGGTTAFQAITARDRHTCGLLFSGVAYCWGMNDVGQLGVDTTPEICSGTSEVACSATALAVDSAPRFTRLSVGDSHSCALAENGAAYCWGFNAYGQLGRDSALSSHCVTASGGSFPCELRPRAVPGNMRFAEIVAGGAHTCALIATGEAYCWGYNWYGQVGDGSDTTRFAPVRVAGGLRFTTLSAGPLHTCGITTGGVAYCWGTNEFGQLGNGTWLGLSLQPDSVASSILFRTITAGQWHSCALAITGAAYCWGFDTDSLRPTSVAGGLTFTTISAGANHTCGLTSTGRAFCWGFNWAGQLGTQAALDTCYDGSGNPFGCTRTPAPVAGRTVFLALSAGYDYSCGVAADGGAFCWGRNWWGQLGDGTRTSTTSPVRVVVQ
jgi:alpha-tubulin suppressor-like RCC1 family protein